MLRSIISIAAFAAGLFAPGPAVAQTTAVTARAVAELAVSRSFRASAEVMSLNESLIPSEVEAIVREVHAELGATVPAGALLVVLDSADLALAVDRIEADIASSVARIEQATLRLSRARDLSKGRFVSADELLSRETELRVLDAELRRHRVALRAARRDVERCEIRAPFAGVVRERAAQVGSLLRRGDPVLTLIDTHRFELEALIPAGQIDDLAQASEMHFVTAGTSFAVRIARVSPVIEARQRISRARLKFTSSAPRIGTSGELRWYSSTAALPADLMVRRGESLGVFIVADGRARFVTLPNAQEGRPAAHSLSADTRLILDGRERLQDGEAIRVVSR